MILSKLILCVKVNLKLILKDGGVCSVMEVIKEQIEPGSTFDFIVDAADASKRLDFFLSEAFERYSRSFFKQLIADGNVLVNNKAGKASYLLKTGDQVHVTFRRLPEPIELKAFDKEFGVRVIAQHPDYLVVFKPAGLMVHKPHANATDVTLVDWLLATYPDLRIVGVADRPAIIHRLDKDTSGLLLIPRTNHAHMVFGKLFRSRKVEKTYLAIVKGHPDRQGTIDFAIGRDPVHKHKMIHLPASGKARDALTHYRVLAYYPTYSLLEVRIVTGRTHQIRVHCAAMGHSVLGDSVYGQASPLIGRQALHAHRIAFEYEGESFRYECPVPEDMQQLIDKPTISGASEEHFPNRPVHS